MIEADGGAPLLAASIGGPDRERLAIEFGFGSEPTECVTEGTKCRWWRIHRIVGFIRADPRHPRSKSVDLLTLTVASGNSPSLGYCPRLGSCAKVWAVPHGLFIR